MSDQNPNKTVMGIPGLNFNAPDEEDEAVEKPDASRQTMFGLPSGSVPAQNEVVDEYEDDGLPTQIVSADAFSFDSEPAEEDDVSDLRSTAMGGLPSLGKRRAPRMPVADDDQPRGPVGGFAKAFDGDGDEGEGALFVKHTEEKPLKHATLMGMSLEDVLAQEKAAEDEDSDTAARSTMFSMPAPSLNEMKASLDAEEQPAEEAARSTMFSMPAPSFSSPAEVASEVSEGEDDDLPTQAIGVDQLEQFSQKEESSLDNRKRLLAKLRSSRKQDPEESETKGTMFGIPGINHERDASGSRAPITGVLKMPKKRASAPKEDDASPLGGSSYTLPRPGAPKGDGKVPSFSLPPRIAQPTPAEPEDVAQESDDATSVVSQEFGKQLEASFGVNTPSTPAPDFGAVSMDEAVPDRFGSQPVIQLDSTLEQNPFGAESSSLAEESSASEEVRPGVDPFAETQVANVNDFEPFSFEAPEPEPDAVPEFDPNDEVDPLGETLEEGEVPNFVDSLKAANEGAADEDDFQPRDPIPTPMFTGMEMERFPGHEPAPELAPAPTPEPAPVPETATPQAPPATTSASFSDMPVASSATGSAILLVPTEVGNSVGAKGQRIMGLFSVFPLVVATPLAFALGTVEGAEAVLAAAPALMGLVAMMLAALGLDPKLRSAGLAVVGLLAGVIALGAAAVGIHLVVALCASVGALFALCGAGLPFILGGSSS